MCPLNLLKNVLEDFLNIAKIIVYPLLQNWFRLFCKVRQSHSRKATLCTLPSEGKGLAGLSHYPPQRMNNMSPRKKGQRLHAIVDRP